MATLTWVLERVRGCCIICRPILLVMVNELYADGGVVMINSLVAGLGYIETDGSAGVAFTDAA